MTIYYIICPKCGAEIDIEPLNTQAPRIAFCNSCGKADVSFVNAEVKARQSDERRGYRLKGPNTKPAIRHAGGKKLKKTGPKKRGYK
jgi:hypothetical protein